MAKKKEVQELDPNRLIDENGMFKSSHEKLEGQASIGYFEEACEYVFYHSLKSEEDKLLDILTIERITAELLDVNFGIGFRPTWSKLQAKKMAKLAKKKK
jgi:hypothetical protein